MDNVVSENCYDTCQIFSAQQEMKREWAMATSVYLNINNVSIFG